MTDNSEDEAYYSKHEEEELDYLVAQAVESAVKGVNIEQLLEVMLNAAGTQELKDTLRKKFAAALKNRGLRGPKTSSDIQSKSALAKLQSALAISAQQAFERVVALAGSRPDIAERIRQIGEALSHLGVSVERIKMGEAETQNFAPTTTAQMQKRDDTGRGV